MILNFQGTALKTSGHDELGTGNYAVNIKLVDNPDTGVTLIAEDGIKIYNDGGTNHRIQFTSAKYHVPFGSWTDFNAGQMNDLNSASPWISPWCDELMLYFSADPDAQFFVNAHGPDDGVGNFSRIDAAIYEVKAGGVETKLQSNTSTGFDFMLIADIEYPDSSVLLGFGSKLPPGPSSLSLLPMSSWTIAPKSITNSTVWVTDNNIVHINGVGDWNELIYTTYTPSENVQYELTVKWNAPSLDFWDSQTSTNLRQLGVWFDTSLTIGRNNSYEGNRSQGVLMYDHDTSNPVNVEGTSIINLTAGTTYYVWISLGTLEDYKEQTITFTDISLREL